MNSNYATQACASNVFLSQFTGAFVANLKKIANEILFTNVLCKQQTRNPTDRLIIFMMGKSQLRSLLI